MRVRMRLRLWKSVSKGERKCIIKNPTKIEKIKEPSQCRLVWWWLVLWMACECRLKKKTKMEKTNYKIMERITLAWGKHKNGKNQLQKTGQTREKLENKKQMPLRTWVPIWWVIFYSFGKQRKSSSCSSSSRTWVLVYHSCSVTLFVPSTLLTFGRRMNLSSILHPPPLESSQQLRCPSQCWNSYFVCNPWPYLSRVQVDVDVGSGSRCEMKSCQMYSMMSLLECTRSKSDKPSLYISKQLCAKVGLATIIMEH